jgi:hypothetical protein
MTTRKRPEAHTITILKMHYALETEHQTAEKTC